MAETTDDVKRDIELTRERMSNTLAQLEQKLNVTQMIKDHPWPAIALALGAGFALSGSRADVKAAAATVGATKGASNKIAPMLDDLVASLVGAVHGAVEHHAQGLVNEIKQMIGAPIDGASSNGAGARPLADAAPSGDGAMHSSPVAGTPAEAGNLGRAD